LSPATGLDLVRFSGAPSIAGAGSGVGGPCEVHTPRPERVDLRCQSPEGGYAVLADSWSPGWSATVDGTPASIEPADELLRAVRVGPGEHLVSFEYRAPGLRWGASVSLLAWLAASLLAWRGPRERLPSGPEAALLDNVIPTVAGPATRASKASSGRPPRKKRKRS
jgi:hypothetical protein